LINFDGGTGEGEEEGFFAQECRRTRWTLRDRIEANRPRRAMKISLSEMKKTTIGSTREDRYSCWVMLIN